MIHSSSFNYSTHFHTLCNLHYYDDPKNQKINASLSYVVFTIPDGRDFCGTGPSVPFLVCYDSFCTASPLNGVDLSEEEQKACTVSLAQRLNEIEEEHDTLSSIIYQFWIKIVGLGFLIPVATAN